MIDPLEQIHTLACALYDMTLVGNPPPKVQRMHESLTDPQPGDLVVEISGAFRPASVGVLLRVEPEFPDDEGSRWRRWVIEPLGAPGKEQGWVDARFVAVPTDTPGR